MFSFSLIVLITILVSIVVLVHAFLERHEPEPPLLPTNQRPYGSYAEPRSYHPPVETPRPTPCSVPSTPALRSEPSASTKAFTTRPSLRAPPPPSLSSVREPQQYLSSRDNLPRTSIREAHRPPTKAPVPNIVKPALDSISQAPPPEPLFGARKAQPYSISGTDLSGPSIKPVHQPTTKTHVQKTSEPAIDSTYQSPLPEPHFGARKPHQYSFSGNNLPRTSIEPVHQPALVQKTPPAPEPLFGARKPQQYSFLRDDLPRTSIDQVQGPATKPLDQKTADPSLDSIYQPPPLVPPFQGARKSQPYSLVRDDLPRASIGDVHAPATKPLDQKTANLSLDSIYEPPPLEPPFGTRKSQPYSFVRTDLPSPLTENINRPAAKTYVQKIGTVVDEGGDVDDDLKDLDHLALRKLANEEMQSMKKCREEERLARRYRQLIRARDLKVKAKQHEKRAQELNDRASGVVFAQKNKDTTLRKIDLHGLTVKEAIDHTNRALKRARELGNSEMRIIVGKGIHSKDGLAKIKPAIQSFLEEHKFPVSVDPRNNGVFVVKLDSAHGF